MNETIKTASITKLPSILKLFRLYSLMRPKVRRAGNKKHMFVSHRDEANWGQTWDKHSQRVVARCFRLKLHQQSKKPPKNQVLYFRTNLTYFCFTRVRCFHVTFFFNKSTREIFYFLHLTDSLSFFFQWVVCKIWYFVSISLLSWKV